MSLFGGVGVLAIRRRGRRKGTRRARGREGTSSLGTTRRERGSR